MHRRTYDGMIGFVDGYKTCFQQFTNYLDKCGAERARLKMEMLVMAVEDVVLEQTEREGER